MNDVIIRVFDHFNDGEKARDALLDAGFQAEDMQLRVADDEAGPVEGNFTVGNADLRTGPLEKRLNGLAGADNHMYAGNYDKTVQRGIHLLSLMVASAQEAERAEDIMRRCGARQA